MADVPKPDESAADGTPAASLVITVLDDREAVRFWIDELESGRLPVTETIVVDGGSTDGTYEELRRAAAHQPRLKVHQLPGCNISEGRNEAVRHAGTDLILVTDAGAEADQGWARLLIDALQGGGDVAAGFFRPRGTTLLHRVIASTTVPTLSEIDPTRFLPSSRSVAFRRDWWTLVGGYPTEMPHCEDLVFDIRLRDQGARFVFVPDAVVTWDARPTLRSFYRQYRLYARSDAYAGLWSRRHATRFLAYGLGFGWLLRTALRRRPDILTLGVWSLGAFYLWRPLRRLYGHHLISGGREWLLGATLVPIVVVVGDSAKMHGYLEGMARNSRR
jgi:cellulose synthase/poly-beta-1,6-N-acetylglucosamine synthase-like glycosyltransferase